MPYLKFLKFPSLAFPDISQVVFLSKKKNSFDSWSLLWRIYFCSSLTQHSNCWMPVGFSSFLTNASFLVLPCGFPFSILRCDIYLRAGYQWGRQHNTQPALWVCFLPVLSQEHSLAIRTGSSTRLGTAKCPTRKIIIPPFPLLVCLLDCLKFTLINSTLTTYVSSKPSWIKLRALMWYMAESIMLWDFRASFFRNPDLWHKWSASPSSSSPHEDHHLIFLKPKLICCY